MLKFCGFLLRLRLRVAPQAVHDQGAEDHGQVGASDAHLAAEEQSGQRPGRVVAQRQAAALLENKSETLHGRLECKNT